MKSIINTIVKLEEVKRKVSLGKALFSEFLGTFFLVFIGCSSTIPWDGTPSSVVQIALTFGITIAIVVQMTAHVSGGHVNPAVTLGIFAVGKMGIIKATLYIICQCLGAAFGSTMLLLLSQKENLKDGPHLGVTEPNPKLALGQAVFVEILITMILVLTVLSVTDERKSNRSSAPFAIGLAISACHLAFIRSTGSSQNPARSFGPALVSGIWKDHWIYWVGPFVGALAAAILHLSAFSTKQTSTDIQEAPPKLEIVTEISN